MGDEQPTNDQAAPTWRCLQCKSNTPIHDELTTCPTCNGQRNLKSGDKRLRQVHWDRPMVVRLPSRRVRELVDLANNLINELRSKNPPPTPERVTLVQTQLDAVRDEAKQRFDDHVIVADAGRASMRCTTCFAARMDKTCWAVREMRMRSDKSPEKRLWELLDDWEMVYDVMDRHHQTWGDDFLLFRHVLEDYMPEFREIRWTKPGIEQVFDFFRIAFGRSNRLESLRRRRQQIQAAGFFPAPDEIKTSRKEKEDAYRTLTQWLRDNSATDEWAGPTHGPVPQHG